MAKTTKKKTSNNNANSEINDLKKDIDSLRNNVVALTKTIADEVAHEANHSVEVIREKSADTVKSMEDTVKARPGRSVLFAFLGGLAAATPIKSRSGRE